MGPNALQTTRRTTASLPRRRGPRRIQETVRVKESISFDRIAERYDATRGGERRGTQLAADIAPLLEHSEPVFEVGAGTGVISLGLRRHGFATFGLDISGQMLARAYERLGPTLIQGDAMHLPLA